jgi:hypothetical protein
MASISLQTSDRALFLGRTGSGKTTLAKAFLAITPRWVILDAKHTVRVPGVPIRKTFNRHLDRQIIRVEPDEWELERWSDVIDAVWRRGNAVLYVDETTLITPPRTILPALGKAIRTGRERGLGVWCGSQRPKDIPSAVFTEAEHFFVFQLTFAADREKVRSFTHDGLGRLMRSLSGHDYVYYNVLANKAIRVSA